MNGRTIGLTILGCAALATGYFVYDSHNHRVVAEKGSNREGSGTDETDSTAGRKPSSGRSCERVAGEGCFVV